MKIRKARMTDVESVHELINRHAKAGRMLARSRMELYENLRDFFVAAERRKVHAAAALHLCWENLAEVKSLAVREAHQGAGIGRRLVRACLREAARLGVSRVFVLTYVPGFFEKLKFKRVDRSELPHRIWAECVRCPEFPDCGEVSMVVELAGRPSPRARTGRSKSG